MSNTPLARLGQFACPRCPLIVVLALVLVALLPASPILYRTPNNDYSIFFYAGREMVNGQMLYRDVYDHKPPLIFLINAAGVLLGGGGGTAGGRWGVWALQLVSLAAAMVMAYRFLERYFGRLPALVALAAVLLNLAFIHERGNLTEEYAYPFQFGALFLLSGAIYGRQAERRLAGRFFGIGLLLGLASSLKQTMAGIGAAMVVSLVFETLSPRANASSPAANFGRWRDLLWSLFWIATGAAAIWLVWFAIFAAAGILPEFWEAVFLMNFGVSDHSTPERLRTLQEAFGWLTGSSGFFLGGMLIWLTVIPFLVLEDNRVLPILTGRLAGAGIAGLGLLLLYNGLFRSGLDLYAFADLSPYRFGLIAIGLALVGLSVLLTRSSRRIKSSWEAWQLEVHQEQTSAARQLCAARSDLTFPLVIALVDLPVAFGLAILTGRNFPHYFMPLIPSLAILFAYGIHTLVQAAASPARRGLVYAWLAALMLPVFVPGLQMTLQQLHPRGDRQVEDVAAYLQANTRQGEPVLQWGIAPAVYILADRNAPTRFFFANPLFFDGYSGEWHTSRLLADLQARPPAVIVDTMMARLPLVTAPGTSGSAGTPGSVGWQDCDQVQDPAYYQAFLEARRGAQETVPQFPAGMGDVYQWICQNYQPVEVVGELNWQMYRLKGN